MHMFPSTYAHNREESIWSKPIIFFYNENDQYKHWWNDSKISNIMSHESSMEIINISLNWFEIEKVMKVQMH